MKKLLALLIIMALSITMAVSFAACDGMGGTVPNPVNPDGTLNLGEREQELTIDEIEDLFEEWDDFVSEGNLGTFAMNMNFRSLYESDDFSFEDSFTVRAVTDGTNSYSVMESTEEVEDGELKMVNRSYLHNNTAFEHIIVTLDGEEVENSRFVVFIEELEDELLNTEFFDLSDLLEMLEDDEYVEFEAASYANGTRIIITDKFESDTLTESAEVIIVFDNNGRLVFLSIDESRDAEDGISEFEMTIIITWGGNLTVARPNAALFTAIPAADDITIDIIVTWSPEEDSFAVGDNIDLEAVFEFGDLEEGHWSWEEVTWSVSNNNASIVRNSTSPWVMLQLVNAGTVTITATSRIDSSVSATFTITILEEHGESV